VNEDPGGVGGGGGTADPVWHRPVPPRDPSPPVWPARPSPDQPPPGPLAADPADPLFPDAGSTWQPRIVPSPPPQRGRLLIGLLAGLLAGLLIFGGAGFAAGRLTADPSASAPTATPSPVAPTLPPYERSQLTLNQEKVSGELAALAEPWLPWISSCLKNGDRGGPRLNSGESSRVLCEYGTMSLYFVQYASTAERDKVRIRNLGQNVDARSLTPGVEAGEASRAAPSGRTEGSYVEYAYRAGVGPDSRVVAALWWDDEDAPVGAYLLAFWADGLGSSWEPIRDVWRRHA